MTTHSPIAMKLTPAERFSNQIRKPVVDLEQAGKESIFASTHVDATISGLLIDISLVLAEVPKKRWVIGKKHWDQDPLVLASLALALGAQSSNNADRAEYFGIARELLDAMPNESEELCLKAASAAVNERIEGLRGVFGLGPSTETAEGL